MPTAFQAFPRQALVDQIRALIQCPVIWAQDKRPMVNASQGLICELAVGRVKGYGWDETRREFNATANADEVITGGWRTYLITVKLESYHNGTPAYDVLEQLKLMLRWDSTQQAFEDAGIALQTVGDVVPMRAVADTKVIHAAVLEIGLGCVVSMTQTDNDGGWIETVNGGQPGIIPGP